MSPTKKITYTGDYEENYNRTSIITAGLKKLGYTIYHHPFKSINKINKSRFLDDIESSDFIFMPSFTHREVGTVKKMGLNKKIIFDPLVSRYMTKVYDYKLVSRFGISALRNYYRDKWSLEAADFVVTDTQAHLDYFSNQFNISKSKMKPLYIGNNFDEYYPNHKKTKNFRVGFYGGFIPLQGSRVILEAALQLKSHTDIEFLLIGSGFEFEKAKDFVFKNNLSNVQLYGWVDQTQLPELINTFDLALGIFGDTLKSDLVIPNKIFHYAACGKPIVTKNTKAITEIFTDEIDISLIGANASELAQQILRLKSNPEICLSLGQAAYNKIKSEYSEIHVAQKLIDYSISCI